MELDVGESGYAATIGLELIRFFNARGLVLRPLGATVYVLPPYCVSAGDLDLECVVSLSPDDPDRFDLVLKGPAGLTRPPRQGPPACSRILTFERGEILNPGKD